MKLFGDSVASDSAATPEGPSWDIDVRSYEAKERVAYYVRLFQNPAREHFAQWVGRGGRYDAMIRAKFRAAGLPEDMTYLALIESGYSPHAYSRAAAVGMWQFMTATAKGTGLRVDWWVDERRDPVRSTDAAIKLLGWLKDQFGSLYLAAAAYNGGSGRVSRGLSRYADDLQGASGDDRFFALAEKDYLRAETRDYVPKLIAAALVAKEPARYGLTVTYLPPLAYDTVRVGPATPLAAIAKAADASVVEIVELNSYVLRGVTPPRDSLLVRVPVGKATEFRARYLALPESERVAFQRATTGKADTKAGLASRYGLSAKQLGWYNPKLGASKRGRLSPGQTVLVPTRAVVAAALDVPDPAVERYGSSRSRSMATHVVRSGESMGAIAKRYRTTVAELKRINGLKKSVIYPGQVIAVRRSAAARSSRATTSSGSKAKPSAKASSGAAVHVVQRGESLTAIARRYGTTVARLRALNGMSDDAIRAGQRLVVAG
ncbi:MAG: LysM peptidoglycan-binding domain-containing protein [Gemmatimonadaceae bacterium]